MTSSIEAEGPAFEAEQLSEYRAVLRDLAESLKIAQLVVAEGEPAAVKETARYVADFRTVWLRVKELEAKLYDEERDQRKGRAAYELDLDAARDSIRCRLDRLRTARDCGAVPD